jgi:ubiquinone biosynthesis protein
LGRRLDPSVNVWELARPLVEEWMRDNRGPEAQIRQRVDSLVEAFDELPRLLRSLGKLVDDWSKEGVFLHAETLATQAAHRYRQLWLVVVPLWLAGLALAAMAVALWR